MNDFRCLDYYSIIKIQVEQVSNSKCIENGKENDQRSVSFPFSMHLIFDTFTSTDMYHSFDYANIHFTAITTEPSPAGLMKGTPQFEWLNKDLSIART